MKSTPVDDALCAVASLPQHAAADARALLGAPLLDVARVAPCRALLAVDAVIALHRLENHHDARASVLGLLDLARSYAGSRKNPDAFARWIELNAGRGLAAYQHCQRLGFTDLDIEGER